MKKGYLTLLVSVMMFSASAPALAKSCKDFPTQQAAQKFYEARKKSGLSGWKRLDRLATATRAEAARIARKRKDDF